MRTPTISSERDSRVPIVLGREQPLPDSFLRVVLFLLVVALAGGAFALSLFTTTRAAGKATKQFVDQFTDIRPGDLQFPRFPERSTIYAADHSVLATIYLDENRKIVHLDQISDIAQKSVLAIEDYRFYEHGALDLESIVRAAVVNLRAGRVRQGGSTITQQLVKNVKTSGERTLARKLDEARLAYELEKEYTKDQILELYLNDVYLGRGVYGMGTAAEFYFGVHANRLSLPQSATLAGLIQAPEAFNPVKHPKRSLARRDVVINRMEELGWVTPAEATLALAEPLKLSAKLRNQNKPGSAPYFVEYIKKQILSDKTFGRTKRQRTRALFQGGLKIFTTLNPAWLQAASDSVKGRMVDPNFPQAAVVTVESQTGAIRTLQGGTDFKKQKFDLASQGRRQAGSAFKPFTLTAAFEQGIPRGKVYDSASPLTIDCEGQHFTVHNAEGGGEGFINLDTATAHSVNVVFIQLSCDTGPQNIVNVAHRMGIESDIPAVPNITLGTGSVSPLEMASAYATLSNEGVHCRPYAIAKVVGPNGKLIEKHKTSCKRVVDASIVATVSSMLRGVVTGGTGTAAALPDHTVVGKTGTTDNHADGWFCGYTAKQLSTCTWVGDIKKETPIPDLPGPYGALFGGNLPAGIWHDYMARALAGLPNTSFPSPPPQKSATVPNVIGKPQAEAEQVLAAANFTAIVKEKRAHAPAGTVVDQSPGAGASVTAGSAVTIYISNGKAPKKQEPPPTKKVPVPNVKGMTAAEAKNKLQDAGFNVVITYKDTPSPSYYGRVIDQQPSGGTTADKGSTVQIFVGQEPQPSPSPSPP